ncbi:SIMPL domain-containing protein [Christensenellaceae bacterium OttesenSCG-928-K19]|nr:SIMPL domain-containing protein [Christensenellaceae bacterium OttesenSCG-928-K19]
MKKTILLVVLVGVFAMALIGCDQGTAQTPQVVQAEQPSEQQAQTESTLTVNATETVKVAPDIAYVYIGVQTSGADAEEAQQANAQIADGLIGAIKQAGVAEEDIETSNVSIYQDYENPDNTIMDNTYKVTIRDIDKVGAVIDAAAAAGANSTYSLSFDLADRDSVYIEALGKAMQSIDAKAKAVADSGGYEIVKPRSIEEGGSSSYYPMMEEMAMDAVPGAGSASTPVAPGEIEVSASVTGTYIIQ